MTIFLTFVISISTTIIIFVCGGGGGSGKKKSIQPEPKAPYISPSQDVARNRQGTQQSTVQTEKGVDDPNTNIFSVQPTDPVVHNRPLRKTADKAFDHSKPGPGAKGQGRDDAIIKLSKHIQENINNPTEPSPECPPEQQGGSSIPSPANYKAKCANPNEKTA